MNEYTDIEVPTPTDVFPPRPGKPEWAQQINFWSRGENDVPMLRDRTLTSWVQQYHQGVRAIDQGVERILKALDATGQRENTLIIFTSDQGFAWGQHGFRQKVAAYDATIRSPLIMSLPGRIPEDAVCPTPVGGVDLVPTMFRFAGIDLPWEMHGHDLTPLLENQDYDWPHPTLLTSTVRLYGSDTNTIPGEKAYHASVPWYVMLREGKYKYVRPLIDDIEELYDMDQDPEELHNLAAEPEHQATLASFRTSAVAELKRTGAGFVDSMPPLREGI